MQMLTACMCILVLRLTTLVDLSTATTLSWVSHPLRPGETAIVSGGELKNSSVILLKNHAGSKMADAIDASTTALKFTLPPGSAVEAWDLSIDGSDPLPINLPDVWWWQGDAGSSSTPGGWVRIFGRSVSVPDTAIDDSNTVLEDLANQFRRATVLGNFNKADSLLEQLKQQRMIMEKKSAAKAVTSLRLAPTSKQSRLVPIVLTAALANTTEWDAFFELPHDIPLGNYTLEVNNGLSTPSHPDGWVEASMFATPASSVHTTLTVAAPRVWKTDIFTVDCDWDKSIFDRPCGWVGAR